MTEYLILRQLRAADEKDDTSNWQLRATLEASSADAALRKAAGAGDHTLVAIPKRSWQPRRITTETRTIIRLKDA